MAGALAWLASGAGAIASAAVTVAAAPTLLIPALVIAIPLATLPLLITTLALVTVYDPNPEHKTAATKVLELLITPRADRRRGR